MSVDVLIAKLRARYNATTDQGLAKAMGLSRSSVANWRSRGSIPDKYAKLADSDDTRKFYGDVPWEFWSPLEKAGMQLALMRLARDSQPMLQSLELMVKRSVDLPEQLAEYHGQACSDLADGIASGVRNEDAALYIIYGCEFFDQK